MFGSIRHDIGIYLAQAACTVTHLSLLLGMANAEELRGSATAAAMPLAGIAVIGLALAMAMRSKRKRSNWLYAIDDLVDVAVGEGTRWLPA